MLLVDASKLDYIKVSSHGLFKIGRKDRPTEYEAVTSPIKVKFDKDILFLFYAVGQDDSEDGLSHIKYSVLNSTKRKFNKDYLKELLDRRTQYDAERCMIKFSA
jgi:hypothetical protein